MSNGKADQNGNDSESIQVPPVHQVELDGSDLSCPLFINDIELFLRPMVKGTVLKATGSCICKDGIWNRVESIGDKLVFTQNNGTLCDFYIEKGE